jgi:hypothetical protein
MYKNREIGGWNEKETGLILNGDIDGDVDVNRLWAFAGWLADEIERHKTEKKK